MRSQAIWMTLALAITLSYNACSPVQFQDSQAVGPLGAKTNGFVAPLPVLDPPGPADPVGSSDPAVVASYTPVTCADMQSLRGHLSASYPMPFASTNTVATVAATSSTVGAVNVQNSANIIQNDSLVFAVNSVGDMQNTTGGALYLNAGSVGNVATAVIGGDLSVIAESVGAITRGHGDAAASTCVNAQTVAGLSIAKGAVSLYSRNDNGVHGQVTGTIALNNYSDADSSFYAQGFDFLQAMSAVVTRNLALVDVTAPALAGAYDAFNFQDVRVAGSVTLPNNAVGTMTRTTIGGDLIGGVMASATIVSGVLKNVVSGNGDSWIIKGGATVNGEIKGTWTKLEISGAGTMVSRLLFNSMTSDVTIGDGATVDVLASSAPVLSLSGGTIHVHCVGSGHVNSDQTYKSTVPGTIGLIAVDGNCVTSF